MRLIDGDALEKFLSDAEMEAIKRKKYVLAGALNMIQGNVRNFPTIEPEPHWISCKERLPEEDHWLGGSGKQFSDNVLVSVWNSADEDAWVDVSHTIDGEWILELPKYCKILAWQPLPEKFKGEGEEE